MSEKNLSGHPSSGSNPAPPIGHVVEVHWYEKDICDDSTVFLIKVLVKNNVLRVNLSLHEKTEVFFFLESRII